MVTLIDEQEGINNAVDKTKNVSETVVSSLTMTLLIAKRSPGICWP